VTCPVRHDLGAYVLGALEPGERRDVEEHLSRCPVCAEELAELDGLPALLDRVPREDLEPVVVAPSPELFERVAAAADLRPARRPRRLLLVAAALLAVLGVGAGVTWALSGDDARTSTAVSGPVEASVTAIPERDGSALDVTVAGLGAGEICTMVAVDEDGDRHPAGEWPASSQGDGRWVGWASVEVGSLDEVVLLGDGGRELVRLDL
jgi:anti-sigma factor RsiW